MGEGSVSLTWGWVMTDATFVFIRKENKHFPIVVKARDKEKAWRKFESEYFGPLNCDHSFYIVRESLILEEL